ncbi:hypothetical protein BIV57_21910 [Mangrovactinospora gilvigrisea]|uniref:HAD family hydrolase n=1 Tax=Mangrovactinospora gilvigrisea TaxID=1428644 RepID=A0A1J7C6W3_9ACTN|nr:HAD family hydrolase [Mangrovactinospora gilvigrisea]OIV35386.1 hypothetical protein BIV57_21910 [Mangrovactinospora gilvigrisea]
MGGGIDAVIFDWGGTLTPFHLVDLLEIWRGVARAALPGDAGAEAVEHTALALHRADSAIWNRAYTECTSADLEEIFGSAGVALNRAALDSVHDQWLPHTYTDPEAHAMLAALRGRGLKVGVLSNTVWPRSWHRSWFERDGVLDLIDGDVYSSEIAWTKPHPEAFAAAMSAVGAERPERCVFVGDQLLADVHGAKAAGMRAVFVPYSSGMPVSETAPDAVIRSLAELPSVVEGWM